MRIESLKMFPVKETTGFQNISYNNGQNVAKPFSEFLAETLNTVSTLEVKAKQTGIDFMVGRIDDVSEVMIATEKANLALQFTMQMRNKVVEAYQEIMRMQV